MCCQFNHLVGRCLALLDHVWKAINRFTRALTILTATVVHKIILSSPHKPLDTTRTLHFPVDEIHLPSKVKRFFLLGYNTCHICRNTCLVKPSPPMLIQVLPFCLNTEEGEKNYTNGKVRKVGWVGMTGKMLSFRVVFQRNLTTFVVTKPIKRQI